MKVRMFLQNTVVSCVRSPSIPAVAVQQWYRSEMVKSVFCALHVCAHTLAYKHHLNLIKCYDFNKIKAHLRDGTYTIFFQEK